jgi:hypothetical protein
MITIEIRDINGRLIQSRNEHLNGSEAIKLPIINLNTGIYIMSVSSDKFLQNQKLIIE